MNTRFQRQILSGKGSGGYEKEENKKSTDKRIPRELLGDWKKYLVVALFLILTIGFVSGMYVANESMLYSAAEGVTKYKLEDGHFELDKKADAELLSAIETGEKADVKQYYLAEAKKELDEKFDDEFEKEFTEKFKDEFEDKFKEEFDSQFQEKFDSQFDSTFKQQFDANFGAQFDAQFAAQVKQGLLTQGAGPRRRQMPS